MPDPAADPLPSADPSGPDTSGPRTPVPAVSDGFGALDLPERLAGVPDRLGFTAPTAIQARTVPALLAGRDVVGVAGTGTGKTAAFGLPLLAAVDPAATVLQAVVLTPTRELAMQVAGALESFAEGSGVRVVAVYGGAPYLPQKRALAAGAQVVVGTPGRVLDHLDRGALVLDELRFFVLDEADEMLQMGFAEDVDRLLASANPDRQTALFSATMPPSIRRVAQAHLRDPLQVDVGGTKVSATASVSHGYAVVPHRGKVAALRRVLAADEAGATLVFVRTREAAEQAGSQLVAAGLAAAYLSGDVAQPERERIVERLRSGALDVVVATDVAARGLDVERIGRVVNLDLPGEAETYVHRVGRTGRAGRTGVALTFVTPAETGKLRRLEKTLRLTMVATTIPSRDEVVRRRAQRLLAAAAGADDARPVLAAAVEAALATSGLDAAQLAARLLAVAVGTDSDAELDELLATARRPLEEPATRRSPRAGRSEHDARAVYRASVGHRDGVGPGALVGALTGEGGLTGDQIGKIHMFAAFSLIEIPGGLTEEVVDRVSRARVAGRRLNLRPDTGPRESRPRADGHARADSARPRSDAPRHRQGELPRRGPRPTVRRSPA